MNDTTIYLHSQTKRLQTNIHLLAAALIIFKIYKLPIGSEYYYRFIFLNIFITFLLLAGVIFQVTRKYKYRELATLLNIITGIFLIIESLSKLDIGVSNFYLTTLGMGTFITLIGACDNQIRQVPHISFKKEQISGRLSLLQPFSYSWQDVADIDFKPVRVKITLENGKIIRYRVARRSANGLIIKSVEDKCWEIMESQKKLQMA
jgi:hypothetical protein